MTEPVHTGDPVAVILARMEVKLDNALTEQSRHSTIIDRHDATLGEHGNRITALETKAEADEGHAQRRVSDRAVFWTMVSALAVVASVLAAVMITRG
ncbi:MAG TPA: hypothetical protein VFH56_12540 [Acidimicrobiales bacterium]|nr:hypothetical protein [Acidimicrobiales bacterium]